jgi:trehalose-6-phosphatase
MQPQDQTIEYLAELSQDSRNIVCVISNEAKETVQKAFRKLPNVWLAAENGYWYKTNKTDWKRQYETDCSGCFKMIRKIFDQYCENIEGTVVDQRESSISWNYKNAAEEHGLKFSKELYNQVVNLIGQPDQTTQAKRISSSDDDSSSSEEGEQMVFQNEPVEVNHGNGFIEVVPKHLRKEKLVELILSAVKSQSDRKIDFLLFIGSDQRDERYFEYFKQITQDLKSSEYFSGDLKSRLCIIGRRPSNADYFLDSENQVAYVIQKLGFTNNSRKRNRSHTNLLMFNKPLSFDPPEVSVLHLISSILLLATAPNLRARMTAATQTCKSSLSLTTKITRLKLRTS